MKNISLLLCAILLTACNTSVSTNVDVSSSSSSAVSSSSQLQSASSLQPIPLDQALDTTFSSEKLGIALRHPSSILVGECDPIPVTALEANYSVQFVVAHMPDESCGYLSSEVAAEIHVQRVTELAEIESFIDRVFSPDCEISEATDYEENGERFTSFFLQSSTPPADEPDFTCGEVVRWNRTAGVAFFSSLGSKTGGGIEWPSSTEILLPDGNIEYSFDFLIMDSIEFLRP